MIRFYDGQHEFYCGVDLHTRKMDLCILDREGNKRLHRNMRAKPDDFLRAVKPFRDGLVVGLPAQKTKHLRKRDSRRSASLPGTKD